MPAASDRSASIVTHPLYAVWVDVWIKLLHVYEGSGGFLDGTYLVAHPREWEDYTAEKPIKPSKKLKARRRIARYENVGAVILDQLKAALFRGTVTRTIGDSADSTKTHPLSTWWKDVDGLGTPIDDYMAQSWTPCGLFGHVAHLMDRPAGPTPETKADEQPVYLRAYTPIHVANWLEDDMGRLTAVKLLEDEPAESLEANSDSAKMRQRTVTAEGWTLVGSDGSTVNTGEHKLGRLPIVIQFSKRRSMVRSIGQSVLGDPQLYIDLYNLTSELRELLRNQTFSILNVVLGTGPDAMTVEKAVELLKATGGVGTENVMFSGGASQYVTAETANVEVYQKERSELLRTIYRLASVPWESDSLDAEAEGSLKLKREDMNQILAGYADECEKAEYQFVELWFRAEHGDRWKEELDKAQITIRYPDTFDVTPFAEILEQAQAAIALEMPASFMRELRKRIVAKFLPDASPKLIKEIAAELDQMAKEKPEDVLTRATSIFQKIAAKAPDPEPEPVKEAA